MEINSFWFCELFKKFISAAKKKQSFSVAHTISASWKTFSQLLSKIFLSKTVVLNCSLNSLLCEKSFLDEENFSFERRNLSQQLRIGNMWKRKKGIWGREIQFEILEITTFWLSVLFKNLSQLLRNKSLSQLLRQFLPLGKVFLSCWVIYSHRKLSFSTTQYVFFSVKSVS